MASESLVPPSINLGLQCVKHPLPAQVVLLCAGHTPGTQQIPPEHMRFVYCRGRCEQDSV